eukprot:GHVQ01038785.1.p1 GENE.GHVQ01038785.1~~GHVQ01038785.1.p1  ORF type:complete len:121 (+),score=14.16 GHVQ01038785.1:538-900(+)
MDAAGPFKKPASRRTCTSIQKKQVDLRTENRFAALAEKPRRGNKPAAGKTIPAAVLTVVSTPASTFPVPPPSPAPVNFQAGVPMGRRTSWVDIVRAPPKQVNSVQYPQHGRNKRQPTWRE